VVAAGRTWAFTLHDQHQFCVDHVQAFLQPSALRPTYVQSHVQSFAAELPV
jgi:hypothetical protein